ncbi:MAG: phosphoribosyl-AMP cyclohydrolase [Pseudomonadota bacterium]
MKKIASIAALGAGSLALAACGGDEAAAPAANANPITAAEVEAAQQAWGEGIVAIGQTFTDEGDYSARATEHINIHYGYEDGMEILFKPTLAAEDQFRGTFEEALSYFVGTEGTEDGGFAIAPYTNVRWENEGTIIDEDGSTAMAMGNYFFTGTDGNETKVEYTFGYTKNDDGDVVITLHHSSLPFSAG